MAGEKENKKEIKEKSNVTSLQCEAASPPSSFPPPVISLFFACCIWIDDSPLFFFSIFNLLLSLLPSPCITGKRWEPGMDT